MEHVYIHFNEHDLTVWTALHALHFQSLETIAQLSILRLLAYTVLLV